MKKRTYILKSIAEKQYRRNLKSKYKRKRKNVVRNKLFHIYHDQSLQKSPLVRHFNKDAEPKDLFSKYISDNMKYLLYTSSSIFHIDKIKEVAETSNGICLVPKHFSIVDKPAESYRLIQEVLGVILTREICVVEIDYSICAKADVGAQVLLDIILKDVFRFLDVCRKFPSIAPAVKEVRGVNIDNKNVEKLLFSIGSFAIHSNNTIDYPDVIPYKLCTHKRDAFGDPDEITRQKDIDTTELVDYVVESLKRIGKELTPEKIDELCIVIGEMLINAEEHSTTNYRYSIGYFQEINEEGKHYGIFRLVIMNFGKTIYEKFKLDDCPNKNIISNMESLSEIYTKKRLILPKYFEEETLWTLYSLQEGVSTVPLAEFPKRGNGSIRFIDNFFNLRGLDVDGISQMTILSGNTNITFDGEYSIINKKDKSGEKFSYMTFNESGKIEDMPDKKYVKYVENYFPGTIISTRILFNEEDLKNA